MEEERSPGFIPGRWGKSVPEFCVTLHRNTVITKKLLDSEMIKLECVLGTRTWR